MVSLAQTVPENQTTMNIITGYLASTEGEVLINGHNILEEPEEAKKCIGYLPELPPVYTDMTVLEYLKFVAELKKIPKDQRKKQILEVMNLVKITDMQNRLIKNLSKGYRQRVGLAQAVLGYPPIIILDEPTVGLDPKQIIEIRDLIKSLGKKPYRYLKFPHPLRGQRRLRLRHDYRKGTACCERHPGKLK